MNKIKQFIEWFKKILPKIKSFAGKTCEILSSNEFVYTYPFAVLALIALITGNGFVVLALFVWLFAIVAKIIDNERKTF
jgi:hypothetical protein